VKKILISLSILVVLIFILVYFLRSPKWEGITKDGNIKATLFETQEGSKKVYNGELSWVGKKSKENEAAVISTVFLENGKREATSILKTKIEGTPFVIATSKPKNDDKIEVLVNYTYKNHSYNEKIHLNKK